MIDVLRSEWLKIRTVRSTYFIILAAAATVVLGAGIVALLAHTWDGLALDQRAQRPIPAMQSAILPFVLLCMAVLGVLTITSEYATGMIRIALMAVPRRGALLMAKATVVAAISLVAGLGIVFAMFFVSRLIVGSRPIPAYTTTVSSQIPALLGLGVAVMVVALVSLGLGAALRSTAGAIVAMVALLFLVPGLSFFLPTWWADHVSAVLLTSLPGELAGTTVHAVLLPLAALAVMAAYVAAALGAGAVVLVRRDA